MESRPEIVSFYVVIACFLGNPGSAALSQGDEDPFGGGLVKTVSLREKLEKIIIPKVEFEGVPFEYCLEFLVHRSQELDPSGKGEGINLVSKVPDSAGTEITLRLKDVPLGEALRYTASLASAMTRIEGDAVVIVPAQLTPHLTTKTYRVKPRFTTLDGEVLSAAEFLSRFGVDFPAGSSVVYNAESSQLVVRNTEEQLAKIEKLIVQVEKGEKLVPIEKKDFVSHWEKPLELRNEKLKSIIPPRVEFTDVPLVEALGTLQQMSMEHDVDEPDPNKRGLDLIWQKAPGDSGQTLITLRLSNVPIGEALRYTAALAKYKLGEEGEAIVIQPE